MEQHRTGRFRRERTDSLDRVAERMETCFRRRINARAVEIATGEVVAEASNDPSYWHTDEQTGRLHKWGWWSETEGMR